MAVLKRVYDVYGSDAEDDDWEPQNVAMVVEEPIPGEREEDHASSPTSIIERGCDIFPGLASEGDKAETESHGESFNSSGTSTMEAGRSNRKGPREEMST